MHFIYLRTDWKTFQTTFFTLNTYFAWKPPSTLKMCPVVKLVSSDNNHTIVLAGSCELPIRFIGCIVSKAFGSMFSSASEICLAMISVRVAPGRHRWCGCFLPHGQGRRIWWSRPPRVWWKRRCWRKECRSSPRWNTGSQSRRRPVSAFARFRASCSNTRPRRWFPKFFEKFAVRLRQ